MKVVQRFVYLLSNVGNNNNDDDYNVCQKKWALFWRRGTGLVNFMHRRVVKLTSYDFLLFEQ